MIDENKLREAVERLRKLKIPNRNVLIGIMAHETISKDISLTIDLIEQLLALKGWPEKKKIIEQCNCYEIEREGRLCSDCLRQNIETEKENKLIDLCKLASIKNRPSREELSIKIREKYFEYKSSGAYLDENVPGLYDFIADAILKLNEKGGG